MEYFSNEKRRIDSEKSNIQLKQRSENKLIRSNNKKLRDLEKELESLKFEQDIMISGIKQTHALEKSKLEKKINKLEN